MNSQIIPNAKARTFSQIRTILGGPPPSVTTIDDVFPTPGFTTGDIIGLTIVTTPPTNATRIECLSKVSTLYHIGASGSESSWANYWAPSFSPSGVGTRLDSEVQCVLHPPVLLNRTDESILAERPGTTNRTCLIRVDYAIVNGSGAAQDLYLVVQPVDAGVEQWTIVAEAGPSNSIGGSIVVKINVQSIDKATIALSMVGMDVAESWIRVTQLAEVLPSTVTM